MSMVKPFMPILFFGLTGNHVYAESWSVTATNPSSWPRTQSTLEIALPSQNPCKHMNFKVRQLGSNKIHTSQILSPERHPEVSRIIFQSDFNPGETRQFVVESSCSDNYEPLPQDPLVPKTFARFVPERFDDFAWENDRIAFRMYGPALATQNGGSGIDCWLKRVTYPIINKWYEQHLKGISYHTDHGEGYDPYHVGQSRGCGGLSYAIGNSLVSSSVFHSYQIIDRGPLRTTFQLRYTTTVNTKNSSVVDETKTATIDLGSSFTHFLVAIKSGNNPAPFPISIGLNTHEDHGEGALDPENGILSVWEKFDDSFLGTGIVAPPKSIKEMKIYKSIEKDKAHVYALTYLNPEGQYEYAIGYGWDKAGIIHSREQWIALLRQHQREVLEPLKITTVLVNSTYRTQ